MAAMSVTEASRSLRTHSGDGIWPWHGGTIGKIKSINFLSVVEWQGGGVMLTLSSEGRVGCMQMNEVKLCREGELEGFSF